MNIEFKVDEDGTVHKIVTADPVITDTVIDPFGFDAEIANQQMANNDDQGVIDNKQAAMATRNDVISNLLVQKSQAMASPVVQELVTKQLNLASNEKTLPVSIDPAIPSGSDDSAPSPDKVPADNETAPVDAPADTGVVDAPASNETPLEPQP